MKEEKKAFRNHRINGIYLNFPNGNGISTIWTNGSYTENHDFESTKENGDIDFEKTFSTPLSSDDVEVMVNCNDTVQELLEAKYNTESAGGGVFGHLNIEKWLDILNILSKHKK